MPTDTATPAAAPVARRSLPSGPDPALLPPPRPADRRRGGGLRRVLTFLGFLAGGALAGYGLGYLIGHAGSWLTLDLVPEGRWMVMLSACALALWPHIVVHEAGHALAGLSRGMQPIAFGVGPIRCERGGDRWRWRYGGGLRGISGFAALLPTGTRGLGRADQLWFLAGGPLANLLTAVLCFALLPLLQGAAAAALLGIALSALFIGLLNLVPFHSQGWRSDGMGLFDLLRRSPHAAVQQQVNQLMALTMSGVRPREWPAALLPDAGGAHDTPILAIVADSLLLSHLQDRRDATAAGAVARRLAARYWEAPDALRPAVAVGLAGHAALLERDAALLAAWRPLCEGGLMDLGPFRHWLDAELAVLKGRPDEARTPLQALHASIPRAPDPVSTLLLSEYLVRLRRTVGGAHAATDPATATIGVKDA